MQMGEEAPVEAPLTEGLWIDDGHSLRRPTEADPVEHLTTLFPPVRLRGWIQF